MEDNRQKFHDKLKELLVYAKKKKNVLEYQEINDFFVDCELDSDQFDLVYEYLESHNVDVLRLATPTFFSQTKIRFLENFCNLLKVMKFTEIA